ncbi:MAG: hypothetical protein KIT84_08715 [Labilithrix sp.]|nr:hypothetical protein [Labilithrix sp.]MCW5811080.1 hypothetical protein [Labilithrix sp.]
MNRWSRFLFGLLLALGVIFQIDVARAAGPELGPAPGPAVEKTAPLTAPRDSAVSHGPIPALPPSYVTKDLGWLELAYPPAAAERVQPILENAAAVKAELTRTFGVPVLERVTVRVAPTFADMARLAPADAPPPAYASGVAYHGRHLVLLTMMAPRGAEATDLFEVFQHEMAHVALEDAVEGRHMPVWFNEGLAISLSNEGRFDRTQVLWNATLSDTLIPLSELDRSFPANPFEVNIAYAESADFVRFMLRGSDRVRFAAMIERIREGQPFERAVAEAYNADLRRLELEWRRNLDQRFSVIPILTGGGLVWVLVVVGLVVAYVRRRRRTKAILARWEREEAIEDARIARALADADDTKDGIAPITTVSLKVEQDGAWHTLH